MNLKAAKIKSLVSDLKATVQDIRPIPPTELNTEYYELLLQCLLLKLNIEHSRVMDLSQVKDLLEQKGDQLQLKLDNLDNELSKYNGLEEDFINRFALAKKKLALLDRDLQRLAEDD